jgi:hypothetical protein
MGGMEGSTLARQLRHCRVGRKNIVLDGSLIGEALQVLDRWPLAALDSTPEGFRGDRPVTVDPLVAVRHKPRLRRSPANLAGIRS